MYTTHIQVLAGIIQRGQKKLSDSLELTLKVVVRGHVGAGN